MLRLLITLFVLSHTTTTFAQKVNDTFIEQLINQQEQGQHDEVIETCQNLDWEAQEERFLYQTMAIYGASLLEKEAYQEIVSLFKESFPFVEDGVENASFLECIFLIEKAIEKTEKDSSYYDVIFGVGVSYEMKGDLNLAEKYYKQLLEVVKNSHMINSVAHVDALHSLARVIEMQYRYEEAFSFYEEAFTLAKKTIGPTDELYNMLLNDYGMVYFFTRNYEKAIPFFEEIKALVDNGIIEVKEVTTPLCNLADCYAHLGRFEDAESLYLEMMKIDLKYFGESYFNYVVTVSRLGDLYYGTKDLVKAKEMHEKALILAEKYIETQYIDHFYIQEQAYLFYLNTEDWTSAQNTAINCFATNCMPIVSKDVVLSEVMKLTQEQTFSNMPYALKSLLAASQALSKKAMLSNNNQELLQAYDCLLGAKTLLHRIKGSFAVEMDKLELLNTTQQISELGIQVTQELLRRTKDIKYQEAAIAFAEYNKYTLLQDALQSKDAAVMGNVPVNILEKEKQLQQEVIRWQKEKIQATDELSVEQATIQYNRAIETLDLVKKELQEDYPEFFQLKYETKAPSVESIQQKLSPNALLLEFFVGQNAIHLYRIGTNDIQYFQLPISKDSLGNQVGKLREELTNYVQIARKSENLVHNYQKIAYWFYEVLLKDALQNNTTIDELIIVPDGVLGHIPFEAIIQEKPNQKNTFSTLDYLVRDYKISYAYSANLLQDNTTKTSHKKNGIFGMAANYTMATNFKYPKERSAEAKRLRGGLQPLAAVVGEVKALESSFKGRFMYENNSTEANFKKHASDYTVLHLAMHGILNEKHPILSSLAFTEDGNPAEDNFLQAYELSHLELGADLVVLSACETGYGKFKQGEGVLSLARSFMFAGVPAMVVSMWQVNDASTAIIMELFYENLAAGMDKAAALQQAKIHYLQNGSGIAAHPAFWAPFIQLGDNSVIQLDKKSGNTYLYFIAIVVVFLGAILVRRSTTKAA